MDLTTLKRCDRIVVRGRNPDYLDNDGREVRGRKWTAVKVVVRQVPGSEDKLVDTRDEDGYYSRTSGFRTVGDVIGIEGTPETVAGIAEWLKPDVPPAPTLDAVWARVLAALPPHWTIQTTYRAEGKPVCSVSSAQFICDGASLAEALTALAVDLERHNAGGQ